MNRTQRRYYGRPTRRYQRDIPRIGFVGKKKRNSAEITEVFPPRWKRNMQSRCCYTTTPDRELSDEDTDSPAEYIAAAKRLVSPTRPVHSDITTIARRLLGKEKATTDTLIQDLLTSEETPQQQQEITSKIKLNQEKETASKEISPTSEHRQKQEKNASETQMPSLNSTFLAQESLNKLQKENIENRYPNSPPILPQNSILKSSQKTENRRQMLPQESILKSTKELENRRQFSPPKSEARQVIPYIVDMDIQHHKRRMAEARKNYAVNNSFNANSRKQYGVEPRRLFLPTFKSVAQQYSVQFPGLDLPKKAVMAQLETFQKLLCECARPTVDNECQYVSPGYVERDFITVERPAFRGKDEETLTKYHSVPKNLHISEVPNVKIVAVKFTKYNKVNIELRRIDEKIVCVEYDVFDKECKTPVQKLRAFFSIKPPGAEAEDEKLTELPSTIKTKFNISNTDLKTLSQKEIEIIDGTILENQSYLHDLRTILRRKQNYAELTKDTLNLHALYELGKQDLLHFDCNLASNDMTKDKLAEMQNLILKNTKSSIHGIRRMTVKNTKEFEAPPINSISKSLINELLRSSTETIVV